MEGADWDAHRMANTFTYNRGGRSAEIKRKKVHRVLIDSRIMTLS